MESNNYFTENGKKLLRISMQFFAEGGDAGTGDAGSGSDGKADNGTGTQGNGAEGNNSNGSNTNTADLDKLVQARADKQTAELGKKIAALQKELDKERKANMTAEQVQKLEMSEKEKELAEREKMLLDKENRLLAIKAIKAAGLDDGSDKALELVDFVIADNEEAINNKVKTFGELVKKFVAAEVDKTFKKNGRNPNSGSGCGDDSGNKNNSVAEKLGKARAEKQKTTNDVLKHYL